MASYSLTAENIRPYVTRLHLSTLLKEIKIFLPNAIEEDLEILNKQDCVELVSDARSVYGSAEPIKCFIPSLDIGDKYCQIVDKRRTQSEKSSMAGSVSNATPSMQDQTNLFSRSRSDSTLDSSSSLSKTLTESDNPRAASNPRVDNPLDTQSCNFDDQNRGENIQISNEPIQNNHPFDQNSVIQLLLQMQMQNTQEKVLEREEKRLDREERDRKDRADIEVKRFDR
jgi:hypothetical protein